MALQDLPGKVHHKFAVIDVEGDGPVVIVGSCHLDGGRRVLRRVAAVAGDGPDGEGVWCGEGASAGGAPEYTRSKTNCD